MKTIIFDNEHATAWVDPSKKMVHHKIKKYTYGDALKELFVKTTEAFEQNNCTKWLSDDRENGALRPADRDWAYEFWAPKIIKAGWKYWAIILPNVVVGQMNMKQISEHYNKRGINVNFFTDETSAKQWLEKQ